MRQASETRARQRLDPKERRDAILDAAVVFFSQRGSGGSTRELAAQLGISVGLINRYFTKDELVAAVYERVFASRVDPVWLHRLTDRTVELRTRLLDFYRAYVAAVDDPIWTRIAFQSALDGSMLGRRYLDEHVGEFIDAIAREVRPGGLRGPVSFRECQRVWVLHSAVVFFLVRKHLHGVEGDPGVVVEEAVDVFMRSVAGRNPATVAAPSDRGSPASTEPV
jgi:AcrR family transcriptional regulator